MQGLPNPSKMKTKLLLSLSVALMTALHCSADEVMPDLSPGAAPMDPGYMHGVNLSHYLSQLGSQFIYGDTGYVSEKDLKWLRQQG